jgi:hypothetical protein
MELTKISKCVYYKEKKTIFALYKPKDWGHIGFLPGAGSKCSSSANTDIHEIIIVMHVMNFQGVDKPSSAAVYRQLMAGHHLPQILWYLLTDEIAHARAEYACVRLRMRMRYARACGCACACVRLRMRARYARACDCACA